MADRWVVALALAAGIGAWRVTSVPVVVLGLVIAAATLVRHPLLLCLGVALLAGTLAGRSLAGLDGVEPGLVVGEVTLLTDPAPAGGGLQAEARWGHRHLQLRASPAVSRGLADRLAGEHLEVRGELAPLSVVDDWTRSRHLAGRLTVLDWSPGRRSGPAVRLANGLQRGLARGASVLVPRDAALFAGLVVGDDRGQSASLADDFRGAGLTHLLAVSGQNVAFVLVLVGPLARRLRLWPRLAVTCTVIAGFALLTRFEPSVSRAAVMAVVAATTVTIGRPASRVRVLALAVTALVLVDPLLVRSLGFQLSAAAALAIIVGADPIARALPGPRWLAEPVAVTAAAQVGVAPLLIAAFGPLPVASIPANLLAVPAAGVVMVWGMTAGVVAGWVPPSLAAVLHAPTRALLWWVEEVAARAARAPLGGVDGRAVAACAAGLLLLALAARAGHRAPRLVGGATVVAALYVAVVSAHAPPPLRDALRPGVVRWHRGHTDVVVLGGGSWQSSLGSVDVLGALRTAGVGAIDLLVTVDAEVPPAVVEAVTARHPTGAVVVPAGVPPAERPPGATALPALGTAVRVGELDLLVTPGEDRLVVEAWPVTG